MRIFFFALVLIFSQTNGRSLPKEIDCQLPDSLKTEIHGYQNFVNFILKHVVKGPEANQTYNELAKFTDTFGSRIAGSTNLERAIDYMLTLLYNEHLDNVHAEAAEVPHWVRGKESAELIYPRQKMVALLGLGGSVGTPKDGIIGELLVVNSFDELKAKADQVPGKIVVYNEPWIDYPTSVKYRQFGAAEAAKLGAVASLIRSIAPYSINSPHTGWQDYEDGVKQIPTACITIEDAEMFRRMAERGMRHSLISIYLYIYYAQVHMVQAMIIMVVLVSGHLDSWDVGQGAMDDGGGAFISWRSLVILKRLGLRPRRTLRVALWTGEEEGIWGGQAYFNAHKHEKDYFSIVMESDIGTFKPLGLTYSGKNKDAQCIIQEVLKLFKGINATQLQITNEGPDIGVWENAGVPGASLINQNEKYFYYHHSEGDTMTVEDPYYLDLCTAFWTATSYIFADLKDMLPR
ncbi:hypothetical protein LAZ67_X004157 [Cordylochernes scorpioides]|uniref:Carboxypeptidase Q n=1 Tax=Cordylochernes scorpioides TaxID=51811 RepID=A0ABY6LYV3_9ARAC|nr:hypothetical protein LAZ67_X004157 [Cordylochernes scorpioides]